MPKRIFTLFCLALLALAPLRAAQAQGGQRLNLIRDAEIENTIRTFVTPIWKAAGLDPSAVEIMIVQDNSLNAFVAGGQRIFINTGLIMRTETPNQLIGVMAHETGHIAGGHLARMQEEMSRLSTMQILETLVGGAVMAGGAISGSGGGQPGPTGPGKTPVPGSLLSFLKYSQTQESSADQASITFLQRTRQSPKGSLEFLRYLQREERMLIGRRDPYLTTHPLTPDRIATFEEAVRTSPYANVSDSPQFLDMHHRMVAKLMGFISPASALQHFSEADRSVPARYARAIALYRSGALGSALLTLDGLLKESPNDPYFHELRGQMLFENGRIRDAIRPYEDAVRLAPSAALLRISLSQVYIESGDPALNKRAIAYLNDASREEGRESQVWHFLAVAYGRDNQMGMAALSLAEQALADGKKKDAIQQATRAKQLLARNVAAYARAEEIHREAKQGDD